MTKLTIQIQKNLIQIDGSQVVTTFRQKAHFYRLVMVHAFFLLFIIISSLTVRFYHLIRFLFSALTGPRKCIGYGVAKQLIGTALVSILQHFKFSTCERTQIPIKYSTTKNTLIPSDGVWLNVQQI